MEKNNVAKVLKLVTVFAVMTIIALVMVTPANAAGNAQDTCENSLGGIWTGNSPDDDGALCVDVLGGPLNFLCPTGFFLDYTVSGTAIGATAPAGCHEFPTVFPASAAVNPNYGMERKGLCKLVSIEDGFLGGYVTAIVKGHPSVLKLKTDGKTYVLPLVPGSAVANGDGTYTAQFYTIDPVTGQALVPAGDYAVRCHGGSGSNDGSGNNVTITY